MTSFYFIFRHYLPQQLRT